MLTKKITQRAVIVFKKKFTYFCHLCRRMLIHWSVLLTEQFLSGLVDGVIRTAIFNLPETLRVNIQMLDGVLSEERECLG